MLKKVAFVLAMIATTPASAGGIAACCHSARFWAHWHRYPNYAACIPYGIPFIPYNRTIDYVPGIGMVPVRVYYVPREQPFYNVPPYEVVAPY
ncbi:MAG: hypothetical protein ACREC1_08570 [Methylovirgula sp.]